MKNVLKKMVVFISVSMVLLSFYGGYSGKEVSVMLDAKIIKLEIHIKPPEKPESGKLPLVEKSK